MTSAPGFLHTSLTVMLGQLGFGKRTHSDRVTCRCCCAAGTVQYSIVQTVLAEKPEFSPDCDLFRVGSELLID